MFYNSLCKFCKGNDKFDTILELIEDEDLKCSVLPYYYGANVEIKFGKNSPNIILGAHYDTIDENEYLGANDNGASVIELIALASRLKKRNYRGDLSIVFFDREESLCYGAVEEMGSYAYALDLQEKRENPQIVIVLDVCGFGDCVSISQTSSDNGAKWIEPRIRSAGISCVSIFTPPSDNFSFDSCGFEHVLLSLLPKEDLEFQDTWAKIHTDKDIPDSISIESMNMMVDMLEDLVLQEE